MTNSEVLEIDWQLLLNYIVVKETLLVSKIVFLLTNVKDRVERYVCQELSKQLTGFSPVNKVKHASRLTDVFKEKFYITSGKKFTIVNTDSIIVLFLNNRYSYTYKTWTM